jgi:hypothetical protein
VTGWGRAGLRVPEILSSRYYAAKKREREASARSVRG